MTTAIILCTGLICATVVACVWMCHKPKCDYNTYALVDRIAGRLQHTNELLAKVDNAQLMDYMATMLGRMTEQLKATEQMQKDIANLISVECVTQDSVKQCRDWINDIKHKGIDIASCIRTSNDHLKGIEDKTNHLNTSLSNLEQIATDLKQIHQSDGERTDN